MPQKAGFIGLGSMGSRMARRLLDAGYELYVRDVSEAAVKSLAGNPAVHVCDSPEAVAASKASPILLSLTMPAIVEDVVLGERGIARAAAGQCVIDLSTTGRQVACRLATEAPKLGLGFLEAPVSGGSGGAAAGTLSMMVSGPQTLFDEHQAVLSILGKQIFYIGEKPGLASTMKLVNQILNLNAVLTTAEAMCVAIKAGIEPQLALDVLNASTGRNSSTLDKLPRRLQAQPRPAGESSGGGFGIMTAYKDVKLFLDVAEELGVPTMATPVTADMIRFAIAQGLGPDSGVLVEMVERWAGVQIRASQG